METLVLVEGGRDGSEIRIWIEDEHTVEKGCRNREAAKNQSFFFVARPLRPYPPPSSLVATKKFPDFFLELQKTVFFLVAKPQPPLSGRATKKKTVFCGFPKAKQNSK